MLCNTRGWSLEMLGLKYLTCEVSKPNTTKHNHRVKAPSSPLIRLAIDFCDCYFYSSKKASICHPAAALLSPPFWLFLLFFRPSGFFPLTLQVSVTNLNPFISVVWQVHAASSTPWKQFLYLYWLQGTVHGTFRYYQDQIDILPGLSARWTWLWLYLSGNFPFFLLVLVGSLPRQLNPMMENHPLWWTTVLFPWLSTPWRAVWLPLWLIPILENLNLARRKTVLSQVSSQQRLKLKYSPSEEQHSKQICSVI